MPIDWRIRCIFAVNLFSRGGELAAITWDDVNAFGVVSVRKSYNQQRKATKGTKQGNSGNKRIALKGDLLELVNAMRETRGDSDHVLPMPLRKYWAKSLRQHLVVAGVTRSELFTDPKDKTQKRLRFHDLRSSGLTWLAIQGLDGHKIKQRAGHRNLEQTEMYIRTAEEVGTDIGELDCRPSGYGTASRRITPEPQHCAPGPFGSSRESRR